MVGSILSRMAKVQGLPDVEVSTRMISEKCRNMSQSAVDTYLDEQGFDYIDSGTYLSWLRDSGSRPKKGEIFGMISLKFSSSLIVISATEVTDSFFADSNLVLQEYTPVDGEAAFYVCYHNKATSRK